MREYETTVIVQPEISTTGTEAILKKMDSVLERGSSTRLMCADLGKRKLAYEIQRFHKGHYYTLSFVDEGKVIPELERVLRMEESVLRFMTILVHDDVTDVEARAERGRELELEQQKRAAEKAAREAEEARARAEVERIAAEEARANAATEAGAAETAAAAETETQTAAGAGGDVEEASQGDGETPKTTDSGEAPAAAAADVEDGEEKS